MGITHESHPQGGNSGEEIGRPASRQIGKWRATAAERRQKVAHGVRSCEKFAGREVTAGLSRHRGSETLEIWRGKPAATILSQLLSRESGGPLSPPSPIGARLNVATGSRRDPTSLAVGETYGKCRPKVFNSTPEGLNSLVSETGDLRGWTIYGFAACCAGWLRLPGTRH